MGKFVAFLRGINVGGHNIIKMEDLRSGFINMGFSNVRTYIQSGNVLFQSNIKDKEKLENKIEESLAIRFNYESKVLVRSHEDMINTVANFPLIFENNLWKHNVIFLSKNIDSSDILNQFQIKKDIEQIYYYNGVLFWSALTDKISSSTMLKLSSRKEYKEMTVRNVNTTNKILELMKT